MREDLVPHQMKISLPASRRNTWDKSRELPTVSTLRVSGEREGGREGGGERGENEREREGEGGKQGEKLYYVSQSVDGI